MINAVVTERNAIEPDDLESLKRLLVAERGARLAAEQKAARAEAEAALATAHGAYFDS